MEAPPQDVTVPMAQVNTSPPASRTSRPRGTPAAGDAHLVYRQRTHSICMPLCTVRCMERAQVHANICTEHDEACEGHGPWHSRTSQDSRIDRYETRTGRAGDGASQARAVGGTPVDWNVRERWMWMGWDGWCSGSRLHRIASVLCTLGCPSSTSAVVQPAVQHASGNETAKSKTFSWCVVSALDRAARTCRRDPSERD